MHVPRRILAYVIVYTWYNSCFWFAGERYKTGTKQQFMSWRRNFQHYLVVFWVQKANPYPNQTLIPTIILFQFKVEQFEVVFWRHDMNCCTYGESRYKMLRNVPWSPSTISHTSGRQSYIRKHHSAKLPLLRRRILFCVFLSKMMLLVENWILISRLDQAKWCHLRIKVALKTASIIVNGITTCTK